MADQILELMAEMFTRTFYFRHGPDYKVTSGALVSITGAAVGPPIAFLRMPDGRFALKRINALSATPIGIEQSETPDKEKNDDRPDE